MHIGGEGVFSLQDLWYVFVNQTNRVENVPPSYLKSPTNATKSNTMCILTSGGKLALNKYWNICVINYLYNQLLSFFK